MQKRKKLARIYCFYTSLLAWFRTGCHFFATPSISTSGSADKKSDQPEVIVSDSVQSAEGVTQEDMNGEFLSNYSDFAKESVIKGLRQHLESQNKYLPDDFDMPSESMYINSGGKKLAVVQVYYFWGAQAA